MKKYNVLQIALLCTMLHSSNFMYTAEESNTNHDTIDISNIAADLPILEEGFQILHGIDTNVPSFHDYVESNLNRLGHDNFGDVIENAEGYIVNSMQPNFLNFLDNEIMQAKQIAAIYENKKTTNSIPTSPQETITSFFQTDNPIANYLFTYEYIFLPIIFGRLAKQSRSIFIDSDNVHIPSILDSLLDDAVQYNHLALTNLLLTHNKHVISNIHLENSVKNHSLPMTKLLLDTIGETERSDYEQLSFLIDRALINNDIQMIYLLLSYGIHPAATTLHLAITKENSAAVKALLTGPVDIEQEDKKGVSPLIAAIRKRNLEIVRLLLQAGADANHFVKFDDEIQPKMNMHTGNQRAAFKTKDLGNFNQTSPGAHEQRDVLGYTPLQEAVYANSVDIAKELIEHGADINRSNVFEGTALQLAQKHKLNAIALNDLAQKHKLDEMIAYLESKGALSFTPHERDQKEIPTRSIYRPSEFDQMVPFQLTAQPSDSDVASSNTSLLSAIPTQINSADKATQENITIFNNHELVPFTYTAPSNFEMADPSLPSWLTGR